MVHESNPVIYADDICIIISTNIIIIQVTFDLSGMILEQLNSGLPINFLLLIHQRVNTCFFQESNLTA